MSAAGLTINMFGLLRKMKKKMMVAEAFVLFFIVTLLCSEIDIQNESW